MSETTPPNTTIAHYLIISKIGSGGMGEVYLAEDTRLDRKVALKILPADVASNRDRMERFVREAKSAATLNHPNIAHIYEIGESDGTHFIAMEFIDGVTLHQKIHSERIELVRLLRYLQHVAEGLAKAHASGIVHRDLKPDNIMITRDGHTKILDFGLAKLLATKPESVAEIGEAATAMMPVQHSTPGVVMGTVGYMSPEQAQAKPVDQRSDIFSFGCILYEAATGRKPFAGDSIVDTLHKIIYEPASAITDFNPSASPDLQRVIRKCLAKEPDKRYQTIRDAANDLEELLEEMEGASNVERSVAPSTSTSTSSAPGITNNDLRRQSTVSVSQQPISSAEYIVSGFKRHKLVLLIALLLVSAGVGIGFYLRAVNSEAAIDSIAVLPFQNRSSDADTEYLSDGLAESLIYRLSQLPNLRVSPTSSVMRYKGKDTDIAQLGKELEVDAVMSGRVSQRGEDLTISVELTDARTKKLIWAEQYARKMSDLLATQREIANAVTQKLQLRLSGDETKGLTKRYTQDNEAYQLYLKGRFFWNKRTPEGLKTAIAQFKAASEKDPTFALAYVGMADSYLVGLYNTRGKEKEAIPMAKAYATKALDIDPSLAEAHATMGLVSTYLWEWAEAERHFKRSIELNPDYPSVRHWYSRLLRPQGRFDEAFDQIMQAKRADELSVSISNNVCREPF